MKNNSPNLNRKFKIFMEKFKPGIILWDKRFEKYNFVLSRSRNIKFSDDLLVAFSAKIFVPSQDFPFEERDFLVSYGRGVYSSRFCDEFEVVCD